ncbi:MAG: hypothetical protein KDE00_12450 [Rhodobacteraceae bacterium]|nr:hypothetical protein [Paracoccaceae bacterium]
MTVDEKLIDRLSTEAGRRLADKARAGRRRAIATISRFCVTYSRDGRSAEEAVFERTPTAIQIAERIGHDSFIIAVGMQKRSLRERVRLALVAE